MSIAVIIPTCNSVRFLRETLESVLGQTLLPDEILINDDASTDGTPDFAEKYAERFGRGRRIPNIRVFRRGGQRQAASRNYAAAQTKCEWIAFLDHDDLWEPNKLERQMHELERAGADLCYTSLVTFRQEQDGIVVNSTPIVPSPERLEEALYHSTTFLPSSVLVRRSKFLAIGGFATHYTIAEDWECWLRLYRSGSKFVACQEPLVRYRLHSGNVSRNARTSLEEAMEVYGRLVVPYLPKQTRWLTYRKTRSAHEYAAALTMRENGQPEQIGMLLTSMATYPFSQPHRYKVLAYMTYMRLRTMLRPARVIPATRSMVPFPQPSAESVSRNTAA